jgi:hypothetical protein
VSRVRVPVSPLPKGPYNGSLLASRALWPSLDFEPVNAEIAIYRP